jgi:hypothetical protein
MDKADFPPSTALALAPSPRPLTSRAHAQVVTVPVMGARFAALEARIDQRFATVDVRLAAIDARLREQDARLDARLASMQLHLIFWILGAMAGNNYLPQIASALGRAIESVAAR